MKHARTPHAAVPNYTAQQPSPVPRTPPRTRHASRGTESPFGRLQQHQQLSARRLLALPPPQRARRRVEENIRIVDHHFSASSHIRYAAATIAAPPPPSLAKAATPPCQMCGAGGDGSGQQQHDEGSGEKANFWPMPRTACGRAIHIDKIVGTSLRH